ncbi:hypothetical protein FKW77_008107 [Venturia effusa]|uniref:Uncharacterized protein n=1 Tax=Venturia effusa TaxID=50376 RepID=A0A517L3T3_9PEZI|nr:hypothetical protein FKW77_008107 [Venturia effusa]
MPMNWTTEADARLFAAVMKVHDIKVNYAALAAEMGPGTYMHPSPHLFPPPFTPLFTSPPFTFTLPSPLPPPTPPNKKKPTDCTAKAITHRIAKIKSDSKTPNTSGSPSKPAAATTTTPKRARTAAAAPKTKMSTTPKTPTSISKERTRRASVKPTNYAMSEEDEEDEEEEEEEFQGKDGEDEGESPSKKMKREDVDGVDGV